VRELIGLPLRVSLFYGRARRLAARREDHWSLHSVTKPAALRSLLDLARGRRHVVEIGTGTAWTAAALALSDSRRSVVTYDPVVRPERDWYLDLCGRSVPNRIVFIEGAGELAVPSREPPADLVYIDGSHECGRTIDTFQAWLPHLAPQAVVAFHDWRNDDYPGVTEAIGKLGLDGRAEGDLYVWHAG
jgi:predicted O-methyltransferase YrrM